MRATVVTRIGMRNGRRKLLLVGGATSLVRVHGEILAKGRRDVSIWEKELIALARSPEMPAIARGSALELLDEAPSERSLALAGRNWPIPTAGAKGSGDSAGKSSGHGAMAGGRQGAS